MEVSTVTSLAPVTSLVLTVPVVSANVRSTRNANGSLHMFCRSDVPLWLVVDVAVVVASNGVVLADGVLLAVTGAEDDDVEGAVDVATLASGVVEAALLVVSRTLLHREVSVSVPTDDDA